MEMPRIELGASYMQSMRSTTELHPLLKPVQKKDILLPNVFFTSLDITNGYIQVGVTRNLSHHMKPSQLFQRHLASPKLVQDTLVSPQNA